MKPPMEELEEGSWKARQELVVEEETEADSVRLRERRSIIGFGLARRRRRGLDCCCCFCCSSSSSSDAEEEGSRGPVLMEPGSSMRKETDSRISARVAGFLGAEAVRRAVAGGRMFALSGMES